MESIPLILRMRNVFWMRNDSTSMSFRAPEQLRHILEKKRLREILEKSPDPDFAFPSLGFYDFPYIDQIILFQ